MKMTCIISSNKKKTLICWHSEKAAAGRQPARRVRLQRAGPEGGGGLRVRL